MFALVAIRGRSPAHADAVVGAKGGRGRERERERGRGSGKEGERFTVERESEKDCAECP